MTSEQKAAFIIAQAACAVAKIAGMQVENQIAFAGGLEIRYRKEHFDAVANYGVLGHNAVITFFGE